MRTQRMLLLRPSCTCFKHLATDKGSTKMHVMKKKMKVSTSEIFLVYHVFLWYLIVSKMAHRFPGEVDLGSTHS